MDHIDRIPGGKGDRTAMADVDKHQLAIGIDVEMEHTDDRVKAIEIALDHLEENPEYYSKLVEADLVDEPKAIKKYNQLEKEDIQMIASMLTEDPDIMASDAGPRVKNLGTALRGNVATTGQRYSKALEKQASGVDPKKLVKEIQSTLVQAAELLADDPDSLQEFLLLTKQTVNSDLLKIAAFYRNRE